MGGNTSRLTGHLTAWHTGPDAIPMCRLKDKTVVRSCYIHSVIFYTGKMTCLYWNSLQNLCMLNIISSLPDFIPQCSESTSLSTPHIESLFCNLIACDSLPAFNQQEAPAYGKHHHPFYPCPNSNSPIRNGWMQHNHCCNICSLTAHFRIISISVSPPWHQLEAFTSQ